MRSGVFAVRLKIERGLLVVQSLGRTPSGQKYVKGMEKLSFTRMSDPSFKDDMSKAVDKLLSSEPPSA
jgi:hypothetical protein